MLLSVPHNNFAKFQKIFNTLYTGRQDNQCELAWNMKAIKSKIWKYKNDVRLKWNSTVRSKKDATPIKQSMFYFCQICKRLPGSIFFPAGNCPYELLRRLNRQPHSYNAIPVITLRAQEGVLGWQLLQWRSDTLCLTLFTFGGNLSFDIFIIKHTSHLFFLL